MNPSFQLTNVWFVLHLSIKSVLFDCLILVLCRWNPPLFHVFHLRDHLLRQIPTQSTHLSLNFVLGRAAFTTSPVFKHFSFLVHILEVISGRQFEAVAY